MQPRAEYLFLSTPLPGAAISPNAARAVMSLE